MNRQLEIENLRLDCVWLRLKTRPWFLKDTTTLYGMSKGWELVKKDSTFEVNAANLNTIIEINLELANRN